MEKTLRLLRRQFVVGFALFVLGAALPVCPALADSAGERLARWQRSADKGDADAMFWLGNAYERGDGVAKNDATAVFWWRKAAAGGDARAMFCLGSACHNGRGAAKDESAAVGWWKQAAAKGQSNAMYNVGRAYDTGSGVPRDGALAAEWWRRAAEAGHTNAMFSLGVALLDGRGVAPDETAGRKWLATAADRGNRFAFEKLRALKVTSPAAPAMATAAPHSPPPESTAPPPRLSEPIASATQPPQAGAEAGPPNPPHPLPLAPAAPPEIPPRAAELVAIVSKPPATPPEPPPVPARVVGETRAFPPPPSPETPPPAPGIAPALPPVEPPVIVTDTQGQPGRPFVLPRFGITLLPVPAGRFAMGSAAGPDPAERPVTPVTLSRPFWLGRTEITRGQWRRLMGTDPSAWPDDHGDNRPVDGVSWLDAMEFCRRLNAETLGELPPGHAFTLPTEAEWEYACRAGTAGDFAGDLAALAWFGAPGGGPDARGPHAVGRKQPNAWGLCDMHGNVAEWCLDITEYSAGGLTDPLFNTFVRFVAKGRRDGRSGKPAEMHCAAVRGGAWDSRAEDCRSAARASDSEDGPFGGTVGFRVALAVSREPSAGKKVVRTVHQD